MNDTPNEAVSFEPAAASEAAALQVKTAADAASAQIAQVQDAMREAFARNLTEARAACLRAKTAADEAAAALESSMTTASNGVIEMNGKAFDALRASAEAGFAFLGALAGARTIGDIVSIQGEHARKRAEAIVARTREFNALAQKIAADSSEPIKAQVAKTFKIAV